MGTWRQAHWEPEDGSGLPRTDRRGGAYLTYTPNLLHGQPLTLDPKVDELLATAERAVRQLRTDFGVPGIARLLLRSEAIASSQIEGIAPSARNVALAELTTDEPVPRISDQARLVANNMTVVREATSRLVTADRVSVEDITQLHSCLLRDQPHLHGIRRVQNWIGGSARSPIGAQFVPPSPAEVPGLLEDLVNYLNGASHSPIVQAALVHVQFETIHPYSDGNGRVGRALIHTVLTRRGLTSDAILPVSLILATFRDRYVSALNAYRHRDAPGATAAAYQQWIEVFAQTVQRSAELAAGLSRDLRQLNRVWAKRLEQHRRSRGHVRGLRSDSAVASILAGLPATPVLTPGTAGQIHGVSGTAALKALDELAAAGILSTTRLSQRRCAYIADEILDLVTLSERQLASTRFDTRLSKPNRPMPARPDRK